MANYNLTQTGAEVQALLDTVAAGYIYMGVADLTTTPDTTNPNVCYLLKAVGTYTNFGNIQHTSGIGIALWNGTAWSYQNVPSAAVVPTDATPTANSTNAVQSGGVYDAFNNLIQPANTNDDLDIADEQGNVIVRFHDKEIETKNFNSALAPSSGSADPSLDYAVVDENGKNIAGVKDGFPLTKNFNGRDISQRVGILENAVASVPTINSIYGWENVDPNNPLAKIRFDAGLTPVIQKWGFIGDSLSSGCHGYDLSGGGQSGIDIYEYSWGQFICRLCGTEGFNFSFGGGSAKNWLTNSTRGWPVAQLSQNFKQAYTLAFGINDAALSPSLYADGIGDADTDLVVSSSDPYDYSNNNEDTFVGCYGGIIQRLRSVNPRCRVFLLTMLDKNYNNTLHTQIDTEIRKIAEKFENCYVIDLAVYAPQYYGSPLHDELVYWSHLTSVGYVWLAYLINTYIDWIIRQNLYAFRDIAFIGTDKYMNQNVH